ncbi:hypothetical protein GCM10010910_01160 [Microbacterium nanhaiense]|uniref:Uncharacterized protein n=1 Tax=Microbacterium nanhaiense TaxID=1301026 RepID=A0ABQ2MUV1_9MICO|nr:hypothetical protein [Microbacterium nanhaiense]GGO59078.1 hypothetical protein GCM10010910_01160 [Microbacterium nanhaiense]
MISPPLDRNKTVYQRLRERLAEALPVGTDIDKAAAALHPYVVAERHDAKETR